VGGTDAYVAYLNFKENKAKVLQDELYSIQSTIAGKGISFLNAQNTQ